MNYLLDTNICIYIIKKKQKELIDKFRTLRIGEVGISSITLAELEYGVAKSQHQEKNMLALEQFLIPLEIFSFDSLAAKQYGVIRTHLERHGTPIGLLDLMIAAHALSLNVILVTNNVKEFDRVPALHVENWV